jgi:hypothetical protein
VKSDYRHGVSDLIFRIPYRTSVREKEQWITIYLLIEHQSEAERIIPFRVLEYVVHIYRQQLRDFQREGTGKFYFDPVIPLVFYTGTPRWTELESMLDLVRAGAEHASVVPQFKPFFLSLPALEPAALKSRGGTFGYLLRVMRERHSRPEVYLAAVSEIAEHLLRMPKKEHQRFRELLAYLFASIYHDRNEAEHKAMSDAVEALATDHPNRSEVTTMHRTIAQALEEAGEKRGEKRGLEVGEKRGELTALRSTLLKLIRTKFLRVPKAVERVVRATTDTERLNQWLVGVVTAETLDDIGISEE